MVAQLAEQSLPTPEICGSNPVLSKILYKTFIHSELLESRKKNMQEMGQLENT